jgi:antitoxin StbD
MMAPRHLLDLELNLELNQEVGMEKISTGLTTSISEFKKNPNSEVAKAGNKPFAVLTNNRPSFYVLPPELYERILEMIGDIEMEPVLRKRLAQKHAGVVVSLDEL